MRRVLGAMAVGYLVGTIPSADVAAAASGGRHDLRAEGSGNPGAANAAKVLGRRWGAAVMVADVAKGMVAARTGRRLAGPRGANAAASAAVVGHCFPVWKGGRGGKGVATSAGQALATFPVHVPADVAIALGVLALPGLNRRALAVTTSASVGWVGMATVWWRRRLPNPWADEPDGSLPVSAAISSLVMAWRFAEADRRAGASA